MSELVTGTVKQVEATVQKKANWFVAGWLMFWKWVGEVLLNLWAAITTEGKTIAEWKLDPLKLFGYGFFVGAAILIAVFIRLVLAPVPNIAIIGATAGLIVPVGGFGSFMFNQAKSNDEGIRRTWGPTDRGGGLGGGA